MVNHHMGKPYETLTCYSDFLDTLLASSVFIFVEISLHLKKLCFVFPYNFIQIKPESTGDSVIYCGENWEIGFEDPNSNVRRDEGRVGKDNYTRILYPILTKVPRKMQYIVPPFFNNFGKSEEHCPSVFD